MLPLRDKVPTRSRAVVTYALIVANVLVWVLYQLPDLQGSVDELAYHPCEVEDSCATVGEDCEGCRKRRSQWNGETSPGVV